LAPTYGEVDDELPSNCMSSYSTTLAAGAIMYELGFRQCAFK
jgi:hypothetical protein